MHLLLQSEEVWRKGFHHSSAEVILYTFAYFLFSCVTPVLQTNWHLDILDIKAHSLLVKFE